MNRILNIVIHEPAERGRDRSSYRGRRGSRSDPESGATMPRITDTEGGATMPRITDPEGGATMPEVTDTEGGAMMPQITDPEGGATMPRITDPDGRTHGAGSAPSYIPVSASYGYGHGCCCCSGSGSKRDDDDSSAAGGVGRDTSGFLIVRLRAGLSPGFHNLEQLAEELGLEGLKAALEVDVKKPGPDQPSEGALSQEIGAIDAVPATGGGPLASEPLINTGECGTERKPEVWPRSETLRILETLERRAALTSLRPRHSLSAYWRVDARPYPDRVAEILTKLRRVPEVELAYRELRASDPAHHGYARDQGYLERAPFGVGARWAAKKLEGSLADDQRVTLVDLEQGWVTEHKDFQKLDSVRPAPVYGYNRDGTDYGPGHHGTAVLGQVAPNGGVEGAAEAVGNFLLASHYRPTLTDLGLAKNVNRPERHVSLVSAGTNGHVAAAIVNALVALDAENGGGVGDILLLEVQRAYLPTEVDEADLDAIRLATALGVTVIEAAGNGGADLDAYRDPATGRTLRRGDAGFVDSGAVLVGAAYSEPPHDRAPFSNYGSRLDCYAWGEGVTTCGYGDLEGEDPTDAYTNTFSGTSSAAPIIAGAAALLQGLHQLNAGSRLMPLPLRALLADPRTGTPQGPNVAGYIGYMPDLEATAAETLQVVPQPYLRKHAGDDGSPPAKDESISSSPDVLIWRKKLDDAERASILGEDGGEVDDPAPGRRLLSQAGENFVYARARNRGLCAAEVAAAHLFWSPAATLIPPERWCPIGAAGDVAIPQGDILTVTEGVEWSRQALPRSPAPGPEVWKGRTVELGYSLLAVLQAGKGEQGKEGETPGGGWAPYHSRGVLPPGGDYFDWSAYRSFLRRPEVGWRNIHRIKLAKGQKHLELAFVLAGAPDRERRFDFEIVQRLPKGVKLGLSLPRALATRLAQRQPALGLVEAGRGVARLELPQRPRLRFSRIRLAAGLYEPALFGIEAEVAAGRKDIQAIRKGHSLAIRQLWRGEEVGRITWLLKNPA